MEITMAFIIYYCYNQSHGDTTIKIGAETAYVISAVACKK